MTSGQLILKRDLVSRPSGAWNDGDYDVLADGVVVGRIMNAAAAPVGASWLWTYGVHPMHSDFQQRCEQAFADHVEALFAKARASGIADTGAVNLKYLVAEAPYIGLLYCAADDDLIAKLKPMVCAAPGLA